MGHTIVFWSPVSGQAGTTSNLTAVAALLGLEYTARSVLFGHMASSFTALEQGFTRTSWQQGDLLSGTDMGVDALLRLVQNQKLQPSMIYNYTLPLLKDRLDMLPGSQRTDESFIITAMPWLTAMLDMAKRAYDLVLVDGGCGSRSAWTMKLLQEADVLVICLPQNKLVLQQFFQHSSMQELLQSKKHLLVFGQYDRHSTWTVKNLLRQFGKQRKAAYPMSYNTGWLDARQHGDGLRYFFRNQQVGKVHDNFNYVQEVRKVTQALIKQCGLQPFFGGREEPDQ
ncbi:hypothetical protein [Paenibacillus sp. FSL R7-0179]|uniref:hypothetical protein n=1 Tax=Paenibacillus sp. FSL R7-0179 TaxID=2921672 RepID=UPI0030F6F599